MSMFIIWKSVPPRPMNSNWEPMKGAMFAMAFMSMICKSSYKVKRKDMVTGMVD